MKYMLDTDTIIYAKTGRPETVLKKFQKYPPEDLCISAITMAELEYGISNSSNPILNRLGLMMFLSGMQIVPFDSYAATEYGKIRYDLKKQGEPIGPHDMLIAAHCKALGLTLITNNTREFKNVDGLEITKWN